MFVHYKVIFGLTDFMLWCQLMMGRLKSEVS